jgi:polysaccharide biosynthesis protein PslH
VNILFLAHRIPYPPNKGDKIRSFHEIKYLGSKHNLFLAFLVDDRRDMEHLDEMKKYCVAYDYDLISPKWQKLKALPYLLTTTPLSIPYFYSHKLQEAVDRRITETRFDAIICFSSPMAEYVFRNDSYRSGRLNGTKLIMDFVDVDSDKWRMYAGFSSFPYGAICRREWRRLQEYEKRVGEVFDKSIFVSEKEVELFSSFCPQARAMAIPNGVDTEYFSPAKINGSTGPAGKADPTVIFIGAMDYFPNEDAVVFFVEEVWPLVKQELPSARFIIVGSKPGKRVTALADSDSRVTVIGYVPDVRPYLAMADLFVAPFRIARGVQNKVLEAMAAGVPVVARPEAVQGLGDHHGGIRVAGEPQQFARAVIDSLRDDRGRQAMTGSMRNYIAEHHCWATNLMEFSGILAA